MSPARCALPIALLADRTCSSTCAGAVVPGSMHVAADPAPEILRRARSASDSSLLARAHRRRRRRLHDLAGAMLVSAIRASRRLRTCTARARQPESALRPRAGAPIRSSSSYGAAQRGPPARRDRLRAAGTGRPKWRAGRSRRARDDAALSDQFGRSRPRPPPAASLDRTPESRARLPRTRPIVAACAHLVVADAQPIFVARVATGCERRL